MKKEINAFCEGHHIHQTTIDYDLETGEFKTTIIARNGAAIDIVINNYGESKHNIPRTDNAEVDERAEFEKWFRSAAHKYTLNLWKGQYAEPPVANAWIAWQARAFLRQPAKPAAVKKYVTVEPTGIKLGPCGSMEYGCVIKPWEGVYPEEPAQLQTLLDDLSTIQSSAYVNGDRITKAEREVMDKFIYKTVGTARAWLDDFAERLGVIRAAAVQEGGE